MIEVHISGLGWIVAGLLAGSFLSAGYVYGFCDAKRQIVTSIRGIDAGGEGQADPSG